MSHLHGAPFLSFVAEGPAAMRVRGLSEQQGTFILLLSLAFVGCVMTTFESLRAPQNMIPPRTPPCRCRRNS